MFPHHQPPSAYTGELFGVEYLYAQSGPRFSPTEEELDEETDEGFGEEELDESIAAPECFSHGVFYAPPPPDPESGDDDDEV